MTTVRGGGPDIRETARMAAEALLSWLRQFEGYRGLLVFADEEAGSARVVTLWESREAAEQSEHGRRRIRESMVASAGVELEAVDFYEIVFDDRP
jgi:heme-degrading monooxygenase HmoA